MCGFAGIVDLSDAVDPALVAAMGALIAHRGPDDDGLYAEAGVALAARRLAIIDLSANGHQPMTDAEGRYTLVHNGEIYNYRELRAELEGRGHRFRSGTDTEVVLAAYAEWRNDCSARFNGMWAFALWDSHRKELFCSRDRFGVKPFYYRHVGDRIEFASELKAFRAAPAPLGANERVVADYLEHGIVDHTDETFFARIRQLRPAHSLTFGARGLQTTPYWQLQLREPPAGDPVDAVRELFRDSVRLQLRSDVPVGTCLSGGIDSSSIACTVDHLLRTEVETARPVGERQKTFTAYFPDGRLDERPYANAVVRKLRAEAHWVTFSDKDLVSDLAAIVEAQDEPFRSTSVIAQWYVMRAAREAGLKVMLDGQGADELLAGYDGYFGYFFANLLGERRLRDLGAELAAFRTVRGASLKETVGALARPFVPDAVAWRVRARLSGGPSLLHPNLRNGRVPARAPRVFPDRFRRQLHRVLVARLPELLHYEDRNSMAHSLEARVPFLDHRLAELTFSLEARNLIQHGRTKTVLRRALADVLPANVADRVDKIGFGTPEARWLRGALGALARDVFHSQSFAQRGWVDAREAQRQLARHWRGDDVAGSQLWRALNLELWARAVLDRGKMA